MLADGSERDLKAAKVDLRDGALILSNEFGVPLVVYAAGQWFGCELERADDRG